MHTMPDAEVFVTVGVNTHKDVHVAVALDQLAVPVLVAVMWRS